MPRSIMVIEAVGLVLFFTGFASAQNPLPAEAPGQKEEPPARARRINFAISPTTPVHELLPRTPAVNPFIGPLMTNDLTRVTEVEFQAAPAKSDPDPTEKVAHQLAKAKLLDSIRTDGFLATLREHRADLVGLPFTMGDDCRSVGKRALYFAEAVQDIHTAQAQSSRNAQSPPFWSQLPKLWERRTVREKVELGDADLRTIARIAALMQILPGESLEARLGLVKHLSGISDPEATRALAKLAIFSAEEDMQSAAIEALSSRRSQDYVPVLISGLKYPYPVVAKRSARAIAKLKRDELLPDLVSVLDAPDPRAPELRPVLGKPTLVVREMVRINHLKSCMMCHAPSSNAKADQTAPVPVPGQKLPPPSQGYGGRFSPDLAIRIDVTYLRQDFSLMLPVADHGSWPEVQRFDFLVRERILSADEAAGFTGQLNWNGDESPYREFALSALKELTGKELSPAAWREQVKKSNPK